MNKLVGMDLGHSETKQCVKCGMKSGEGNCCKDEHKQIKLHADHQNIPHVYLENFNKIPCTLASTFTNNFSSILATENLSFANAPPPLLKERRYILNCVFLI